MKSTKLHNSRGEHTRYTTDALLDILFCIFLGSVLQLACMLLTSILGSLYGGYCVRSGHLSWFITVQDKTYDDELGNS